MDSKESSHKIKEGYMRGFNILRMLIPSILPLKFSGNESATISERHEHYKSFSSQFAQTKIDRYPHEVLEALEDFGAAFKNSIDQYIETIRTQQNDPYYDVVGKDLTKKLNVSRNAIQVWHNFLTTSGKKLGVGDLLLYMWETGDFEPINALSFYCKKLQEKKQYGKDRSFRRADSRVDYCQLSSE